MASPELTTEVEMPELLFPLDSTKKFTEQQITGHNRWHPDIPAAVTVKPGDTFRAHCREWFDGAIHNDDSAEDILNAPLKGVHCLSGPFAIEGAEPGDLLIVDILDVGPIPQEDSGPLAGQGWGYTGIFAKLNGGGFLTEQFPDAYKAIWDFAGQTTTSRHIPRVKYTGIVHPGLMGTAPSTELLAKWNAREGALIATDPNRVPPLALPPEPDDAILGSLSGDAFTRVAAEAARTAPPRENGGNQDIKNLTKGSRVFYPVFVPGANLSFGDLHFSQGDGEITFCGAIEMGGFMDLHVDLIKGGMHTYNVHENAIFMPGNTDPLYSEWIAFSGTSVTLDGEQKYLDSDLAYQRACLHAIDYLTNFGYSPEQAYLLLGSAPIEGRLSGVVDIPNSCATVYIPTAIFDFPITPSAAGPQKIDPGMGAPHASF
jgi:formamidase